MNPKLTCRVCANISSTEEDLQKFEYVSGIYFRLTSLMVCVEIFKAIFSKSILILIVPSGSDSSHRRQTYQKEHVEIVAISCICSTASGICAWRRTTNSV